MDCALLLIFLEVALLGSVRCQRDLPYPLQFFYLSPRDAAVVLAQNSAAAKPISTVKTLPPSYVAVTPDRVIAAVNTALVTPTPAFKARPSFVPAAPKVPYHVATAIPPTAIKGALDGIVHKDEPVETAQFHSQDVTGRSVFGFLTADQARVESRGEDGSVRGSYSYLDPSGRPVKVQYWDDGSGFQVSGSNHPSSITIPEPVRDTPEVQAARDQHLQLFQQALLQLPALPQRPETSDNSDDQGESVVVESDYHDTGSDDEGELTRYPNLQDLPQALYDPTQVHDPGRDAVIVDANKGDFETNSLRSGKSAVFSKTESEKRVDPAAGVSKHLPTENERAALAPVEKRGFFYSFSHSVPIYVQVKTVQDDKPTESDRVNTPVEKPLSYSQKAAYFGALPIAAVHALQVPPQLKGQQVLKPLYAEQPPTDEERPLSYSQKAVYFGGIPVAAVHDQQKHPLLQQHQGKDHQTLPVYVEAN